MSAPASWYAARLRTVKRIIEIWEADDEPEGPVSVHRVFQMVWDEITQPAPESPAPGAGPPG